jgi:nicotinate-nucleotide adenylyltransferase
MIALLGGSFDPVHNGHLALAALFDELLHPDQLRVIPAGNPWQRAHGLKATAAQRIDMIRLAFAEAGLPVTIDRQEIERTSATYTIDTLRQIRAEVGPDVALVFLMGADQLQHLDSWHDWRGLFALAHFGVAARPGYSLTELPAAVQAEITPRLGSAAELRGAPAGRVLLAPELAVDVSATRIRAALARPDATNSVANSPVGGGVLDYIQQHHLYKN